MEKELLRATPMAHLFPLTDLHIFTKGAYNHKLIDSKLSPWESELWVAATCKRA